jgi:hypothetical protein
MSRGADSLSVLHSPKRSLIPWAGARRKEARPILEHVEPRDTPEEFVDDLRSIRSMAPDPERLVDICGIRVTFSPPLCGPGGGGRPLGIAAYRLKPTVPCTAKE